MRKVCAGGSWCGWRDSNSHGFPRRPLKTVCLPVPPHPQCTNLTGDTDQGWIRGFEPPRLSAPPPQDGVFCQFHHFRTHVKRTTGAALIITEEIWALTMRGARYCPKDSTRRYHSGHDAGGFPHRGRDSTSVPRGLQHFLLGQIRKRLVANDRDVLVSLRSRQCPELFRFRRSGQRRS